MLGERELQNGCALRLSNPRTLGAIRGSGRSSVPLHRASRHAWIDVTPKGPVRQHTEAETLAILTEMSSQPQKKKPKTSHTR
jgi:hypothetical protein